MSTYDASDLLEVCGISLPFPERRKHVDKMARDSGFTITCPVRVKPKRRNGVKTLRYGNRFTRELYTAQP